MVVVGNVVVFLLESLESDERETLVYGVPFGVLSLFDSIIRAIN